MDAGIARWCMSEVTIDGIVYVVDSCLVKRLGARVGPVLHLLQLEPQPACSACFYGPHHLLKSRHAGRTRHLDTKKLGKRTPSVSQLERIGP